MAIKAVLFDLDGTLLDIDMPLFLKHYFQLMVGMAREKGLPHQELPGVIMKATEAMLTNLDANKLNQQVFEEHFFPAYPGEEGETRQLFDDFYAKGFPTLAHLCSRFEGISDVVKTVFNKGFKVVIATNSVFPRSAIQNRMDWAGVGDFPYDLITSYENMHFTKPHLHYYREICSAIGTAPEECLMVGNDVGEDVVARALGMKTFLLKERLIPAPGSSLVPDHEGYIEDLHRFMVNL